MNEAWRLGDADVDAIIVELAPQNKFPIFDHPRCVSSEMTVMLNTSADRKFYRSCNPTVLFLKRGSRQRSLCRVKRYLVPAVESDFAKLCGHLPVTRENYMKTNVRSVASARRILAHALVDDLRILGSCPKHKLTDRAPSSIKPLQYCSARCVYIRA